MKEFIYYQLSLAFLYFKNRNAIIVCLQNVPPSVILPHSGMFTMHYSYVDYFYNWEEDTHVLVYFHTNYVCVCVCVCVFEAVLVMVA
jgi:hypothetical protein